MRTIQKNDKKLNFIRPFQCDILIFDTIGSNWMERCLPGNYSIAHVDIRHGLPFLLSFRFLYLLVKCYIQRDRSVDGWRALFWLSAVFDHIKPKLILTGADNNPLISHYASNRREIPVICLQNALRDTIGSVKPGTNLPIYLSLGSVEAEIFTSIGIRCRDYRPIGSVKLGLALSQRIRPNVKSFDLCFISHYRPELVCSGASNLYKKIDSHQRSLFQKVVNYASLRRLSIGVVSKTRDVASLRTENNYFSSIAKSTPFTFIEGDKDDREFDTYFVGLSSGLVIHLASTLGFELFSAKKKVIFGASQDPNFIHEWGIRQYFDILPEVVKLTSESQSDFNRTCDFVREMSVSEYLDLTQKLAHSVVSMPKDRYPHTVIQKMIEDQLS